MSVAIHVIHYRPFAYRLHGDVLQPEIVWGEDADLSELRCHRAVWREGDDEWPDYVGFHHYRRAFLYQPLIGGGDEQLLSEKMHRDPQAQIEIVSRDKFIAYMARIDSVPPGEWTDWLRDVDLIVPRPLILGQSMADHYRTRHRPEDWETFARLLREENLDDGRLPFLTAFNMFVARSYLFDDYMTLWSRVVERARPLIAPSERVFGYLSERLFTAWLHRLRCDRPRLRIITLPVLFCPEMP